MLSIIGMAVLMMACGGDKQGSAGGSARATSDVEFDGDAALGYVREQLAFGPRVPGSEGHRNTGDWITRMMRARADSVIEQRWTHVTQKGDSLPMRNILARFRPAATERVLYVTHWDTRPKSDGSGVPKDKRNTPIPGANDGASGVGLFVALGDVLKKVPPSVGVDLLFVDGEDYGEFGPPDIDVLIGAKYFAGHLPSADYAPLFGVLWDMIGDRDLKIEKEENSLRKAPEVVARVWEKAASLGYGNVFVPTEGLSITDDHIPLLEAKLRVIDVIDLDYPWHHTPDDTIDKVSAKSLKIIGDVAWGLVK
ncbi:MAG: M28 family peptidase [Gemmatimonadaceae bacterium]